MQTECEKVNLHLSNNFNCIGSCVCLARCLWIFIANPPPRRPIAINSRPATDFFLAYNSFLPFLACVAWLLLLCYCCFLCATIFVVEDGEQIFVYRLLPILLPGAQLRLTVDLPLIVSRYRTSDIPFAAKPRNIFSYLDKYIDNFWQ